MNTNITDTREYLDHIIKCTNMKCLTPEKVYGFWSLLRSDEHEISDVIIS